MERSKKLTDGYLGIMQYLDSIGCSVDTSRRYRSAYASLERFFLSKGLDSYSHEVNVLYRESVDSDIENETISNKTGIFRRRLSHMFDDWFSCRPIQGKYSNGKRFKYTLNQVSERLLGDFVKNLNVSPITIPGICSIARDFLHFAEQEGIYSTQEVTADNIVSFIKLEAESHRGSMNNVLCYLRKILQFLALNGFQIASAELASYKTVPTRRKIYPAFTDEDLGALLLGPDRDTAMGKRDYAVILLASLTGLRAIDIANLTFENIDQECMSICFSQHKTGSLNALPISYDVLAAINDYTQDARPECEVPQVFLTMDKPYRKLHDMASVRNIVNRYIRRCGIEKEPWDGKTFHAFRRTIGKWLLESSVDAQMISQVLGHRDGEILKRYLPLSLDLLRECALDFTYTPLEEGVYK